MLLLRSSVLVFGTQQRIPHGILKIQKHFFNQATCGYFPWNALPLLPAFSLASCRKKCPICFYCHRRDDIRSFLCYVVVKNQPRHKGNDVIIPFLILIQAELEKNAWNMLRFSGIRKAGQSNRIFRIIFWIFQNEVNR